MVHVGQSAVLLAGPDDRLLPVSTGVRGLVAGGVFLPLPDDFGAVRLAAATAGGDPVDLSGWRALPPAAVHGVDLRLTPQRLDDRAARAMLEGLSAAGQDVDGLVAMDPRPLRALAPRLASAALRGDRRALGVIASRLIGAGPGATPAGDDVVVGVLAGLRASDAGPNALAALACVVAPLLPRTTRASRHDLRAALEGEFSQHVHALVRAMGDVSLVPQALRAAHAWGATSGLDLAAGVAWSVDVARRPRGTTDLDDAPALGAPSSIDKQRCA